MRHSDRVPEQAAVLAFRNNGNGVEVCLIRKKQSRKWGIPKGFVDPGETHAATALKEALEEAGISGDLIGDPIGTYQYQKWNATFTVLVYLMRVQEEHADWEEAGIRKRKWIPLAAAVSILHDHPVRRLLTRAIQIIA